MGHQNAFQLGRISLAYQIIKKFYSKNGLQLKSACKITVVSLILYTGFRQLYDSYFGPLRDIPGPFITRFMELPSIIYDMPLGTLFLRMNHMHDKYGSVVRTGPRSISVSDKNMIKEVLAIQDLPKGSLYSALKKSVATMFTTRDKNVHKHRRRLVASAFSIKYVDSLEQFMMSVTRTLLQQIDKEAEETRNSSGYGTVDIWTLMQCLTLDVLGEAAFGESFRMVEDGNHVVPKSIMKRMRFSAFVMAYPTLANLIVTGKQPQEMMDFLTGIYQKRKNSSVKRNDILQILIDTQDAENIEDRMSTEVLLRETVMYLIAGTETTSNTLSFALISLLRYPDSLRKLYQEIDTVPMKDENDIFNHEPLKQLPYLNAVINETLRLNPVASNGLPRCTVQETTLGNNLVLPKDVEVRCHVYHMQLNEKYWHNPTQFLPERWIPGEPAHDELNQFDASMPFSKGSRNCIGQNFALQEMRIALATFLKHFDIAPIDEEMKETTKLRQRITLSLKKPSFNIKIKRRI